MIKIMPFLRVGVVAGVLLAITACTSMREKVPEVELKGADATGVGDALQSPLYDLNLKKQTIPEALLEIELVYGAYAEDDCGAIRNEIHDLTRVLGPDVSDLEKRGRGKVTLDAKGAIGGAVSGLIPYNNVLRWISGASRHEKKIAAAYFRGHLRRAFLKGRLAELRCTPVPRLNPVVEHTSTKSPTGPGVKKMIRPSKGKGQ
jgi:hypothetical protein